MEVLGIYIPAKATVYRCGTAHLIIVTDYGVTDNICLRHRNKKRPVVGATGRLKFL